MSRYKTPLEKIAKAAEKRKILRELLPQGCGVRIAKMAGVSKNSVCSYFNGKGNNAGIIKAINQILDTEINDCISEEKLIEKAERLKALLLKKYE
jgi:hypothetical protein